jgi:hypothetical protein
LLGLEIKKKRKNKEGNIRNPFLFEDFKLGRYILQTLKIEFIRPAGLIFIV